MIIFYKIEGKNVPRNVFQSNLGDTLAFNTWEKVIEEYKQEIERRDAAIVFKIGDNEFRVLTETYLLVKLTSAVKMQLQSDHSNVISGQVKEKI